MQELGRRHERLQLSTSRSQTDTQVNVQCSRTEVRETVAQQEVLQQDWTRKKKATAEKKEAPSIGAIHGNAPESRNTKEKDARHS